MQSHSCGALTDSVPTNVQNNGKEFYFKKYQMCIIYTFWRLFKKNKKHGYQISNR